MTDDAALCFVPVVAGLLFRSELICCFSLGENASELDASISGVFSSILHDPNNTGSARGLLELLSPSD